MFSHALQLLVNPQKAWSAVSDMPDNSSDKGLLYVIVLAVLPAIAWYYGTTQVGWSIGDNDPIRFTEDSAIKVIVLFYGAMVASCVAIGWFIHWMSETYGAHSTITKGIRIAGFTATPLFLTGLVGFYPSFLLDFTIGMVTVCWSTYLMYVGIPIVMKIPQERGFLFSSAVLAVCLVMLTIIMGASVILWDFGAMPGFTD